MEKEPTKFYTFRESAMLNTFKIRTVSTCAALNNWLNASAVLTDYENATLDFALQRYHDLGRGWNEEELKMHFISSILNVANPNIPDVCKTFFERPLHGIIDNYDMTIVTDCMVASPRFAGACDFFADDAAHRTADKFEIHRSGDERRAAALPFGDGNCIGEARFCASFVEAFCGGLRIDEAERVNGEQIIEKHRRLVVKNQFKIFFRTNRRVVIALRAFVKIGLHFLHRTRFLAAFALKPDAFGRIFFGPRGRVDAFFEAFEPTHFCK